jgi:hypothetical protein
VLPDPLVKDRLSALVVGLAIDWYSLDPALEELFLKNLPEPSAPMVGFLTAEGVWVDGFSGRTKPLNFLEVVERVEKSPLLQATPAVRKALEKHAAAVGPAAEKGNWPVVLVAAREARKSIGRCPERAAIRAAEQQAREWGGSELAAIVKEAKAGGDISALRKRLTVVRQKFPGEPEAEDADQGLKALQKLALVRDVEAAGNPARDLRVRHAAPFAKSRWVEVFEKGGASGDEK